MAFIFVVVFEWPATRGSIYTGKFTMKCVASKSYKLVKFKASHGSSLILPKKPRLRHFSLHKKPNMQVIYKMNQGYQNNYNSEWGEWSDERVPKWFADFSQNQVSSIEEYESATWPNGEPRMHNLVTNTLIIPDMYKTSKNKQSDIEIQTEQASLFNKQVEEIAKKMEDKLFMSRLPRFSAGYIARMNAASDKCERTRADKRFYTWEKGVSASTTSHTAWGHRRNGGGKGKKETLKEMNCEKAAAERAAAKRIRQKLNKEKAEADIAKRMEALKRVNENMKLNTVVVEQSEPTEEELVKAEITKINSEHMAIHRAIVTSKLTDRSYFVEKQASQIKEIKWNVVDKKSKKTDRVALKLAVAFYTDNAKEDFIKEVSKKPMTKTVKRTRFCSSVRKGGACPHGSRCNFAHTIDELTPKMCAFEKRSGSCKCVRKVGTSFSNKGRKVCEFLHEGETKVNMCRRIGVKVGSAEIQVCKPVAKCLPVVKATPMGTKVLKPYSKTMAWGPVV